MTSVAEAATTTYNGWTNRETWIVNMWLTNINYIGDAMQRITENYSSVDDLARELEEWVKTEYAAYFEPASIWGDLMNDALAKVDWREIAEANIDDSTDDYAHCVSCDRVINLDKDTWTVEDDRTYCQDCR